MAAISAARRWARLCWWLGLSATTMVIAACGSLFTGGCKSTPLKGKDAGPDTSVAVRKDAGASTDVPVTIKLPDAATKPDLAADAESLDVDDQEANPTVDGGKSDLWEIICE
jgi:hypothetical protein